MNKADITMKKRHVPLAQSRRPPAGIVDWQWRRPRTNVFLRSAP
jgi:hypothetical protein